MKFKTSRFFQSLLHLDKVFEDSFDFCLKKDIKCICHHLFHFNFQVHFRMFSLQVWTLKYEIVRCPSQVNQFFLAIFFLAGGINEEKNCFYPCSKYTTLIMALHLCSQMCPTCNFCLKASFWVIRETYQHGDIGNLEAIPRIIYQVNVEETSKKF